MRIIAAVASPHQDDVIEHVLRHLKIWDPPWMREPRARGPPSRARASHESSEESGEPFPTERIDEERNLDEYAVDPPWQDEF